MKMVEFAEKMENTINKITERINRKLKYACENFEGWNESHSCRMAEIDGMLDVLSMITGKEYIITENGIKEIKENENK